jgi:long-chain acyl-CoA synthetase
VGDVSRINGIAALPLYDIFTLTLCLLAMRWGAHVILIPNPRDIGRFVDVLKQRPFHRLQRSAAASAVQVRGFSQLCVSQAGGMAASDSTARQ